jgi:hypothetical protein
MDEPQHITDVTRARLTNAQNALFQTWPPRA